MFGDANIFSRSFFTQDVLIQNLLGSSNLSSKTSEGIASFHQFEYFRPCIVAKNAVVHLFFCRKKLDTAGPQRGIKGFMRESSDFVLFSRVVVK